MRLVPIPCTALIGFLSIIFIITAQTFSLAQDKKPDVTSPETPKERKLEKKLQAKLYSPAQFAHESVLFVKQPGKWKNRDWVKLGIVTASTLAVMPFDQTITNSSRGYQRYFYRSCSRDILLACSLIYLMKMARNGLF